MPNKMTDNEIIKALECCSVALMYDEEQSLYRLALDLINRQKAEIERLTNKAIKQRCEIESLEELSNELKSDNRIFAENQMILQKMLKTTKAEAVKEFAEIVKELFPSDNEPYQYWEIHEGVDNLLKEKVGENDAD